MNQQNGRCFQMILFQTQKIQIDKQLELTEEFSKVTRYTFKIPKSIIFTYINNKRGGNIFLKNAIYSSIEKVKYLGINLIKDV